MKKVTKKELKMVDELLNHIEATTKKPGWYNMAILMAGMRLAIARKQNLNIQPEQALADTRKALLNFCKRAEAKRGHVARRDYTILIEEATLGKVTG